MVDYSKVDPELARVENDFKKFGRPGLKKHMKTLGIVSSDEGIKPPRISVFLRCGDEDDFSDLAAENIIVNQTKGNIRTGFLPIEKISQFSDDPKVKSLASSEYFQIRMDIAPKKVNLPQFKNKTGLDGTNVIIGVVDSGIDPNHPAFSNRILRIWDQVMSGPGVPEGKYGMELKEKLLEASRDTMGHGTHVAGIAAGQDNVYGGVAPNADLIIVKTSFKTTEIADGVMYIFRVAKELNRPAVINLSLGGHFGPHDGTDLFSQKIDQLSGSGRIVCCAAGNEGNDNMHAQTKINSGETKDIKFFLPGSQANDVMSLATLNGWYSGDDEIIVSLIDSKGVYTKPQEIITSGNPLNSYKFPDYDVDISTPPKDPNNGDHRILITLKPSSGQNFLKSGSFKLSLEGKSIKNGVVDFWSPDDSGISDVVFSDNVSDSMKIGSPGSAKEAITIASYTTKIEWKTLDGKASVRLKLNDISDFSSEGPSRNGFEKPDIAAPGAFIVAPLSADSSPHRNVIVTKKYQAMQGTSMATPFVTGIVALLLQRKPDLTSNEIKQLLKQNSSIPNQNPGSFDKKWGYGIINTENL